MSMNCTCSVPWLEGEGHTDSDIDFIYQFDDTANPMIDEWALRDDLASTFGREIDLVKKTIHYH